MFMMSGARDAAPLMRCIVMLHFSRAFDFAQPHPFLHRFGYSPLHWAAQGGRLQMVRLLVSAGANVNMGGG